MIERVRFTKVDRLGLVSCVTVALGALGIMYIGQAAATSTQSFSVSTMTSAENGATVSATTPSSASLNLTLSHDGDTVVADDTTTGTLDEVSTSVQGHDTNLASDTNVDLRVESDEPASVHVDEQDISVNVENTGTLNGSSNKHDIDIDRDIDIDQKTTSRGSRTRTKIDVDAGNNEVSGNENTGVVDNGNVNIDFSFH